MRATVAALTDVAEALRGEYELRDGKYVLKVEGELPGFVTKTDFDDTNRKLAEFRNNNRGLNEEKTNLEAKVADLTKKFEGIEPEKVKELQSKVEAFEKGGVKDANDINALVQKQVSAAVGPIQKSLDEMTAQKKAADEKLAKQSVERELTNIAVKVGVNDKAMEDVLARGMRVFRLEGEKIVAKNGDTPVYQKDKPAEPLTTDAFFKELLTEAPHLFKPSSGGGADPANPGGGTAKPTLVIPATDPLAFGRNLEKIAKGEARVE